MQLRWGILGCARISRRGLIPGIQDSRTGTLAAIGSRDLERARAWAEEFAIPKAYGGYEEVLADAEIDAVYVPLPNELHKRWVEAAADAGKHILCEKPLALDAAEARAMAAYCRSKGVLLMEAFMWRHQPRTLELKTRVAEGLIGELRLIRASFSFPIELGDWRLDPSRGGGALWDVGCYGVNTARLFAGSEPEKIRATARFHAEDVDLSLVAALEFPGGVLAAVDCSFEQPFRCAYELIGSKGVIEVPDAYLPPTSGAPLARLRAVASSGDGEAADPIQTLEFPVANQYAEMVDSFSRSVGAGSLEFPAEDGVAQMEALEAIRTAAAS
jgi:predicted dehydrogenase